MPFQMVDGVRLCYEISGEGPPLVLVHGSWGDHNGWELVAPKLAVSFTVMTYDRRGYSQSQAPEKGRDIAGDIADLAGLTHALGLAPAHVVGSSSGAYVVLRTACVYPELFRSLVVHEPPLLHVLATDPDLAGGERTWRAFMDRVIGFLEQGQRLEAVKLFMETMLFKPGDWEQVPLESRERWIDNAHTFLEDWRDLDGWSVPGKLDLEALGAFPHPALLTCGRTSPAFFLSTMPALEQAMPRARVHEYPDAGHVPQASHPDEYVRVLTDHLRSVECQALTAR